LRLSLQKWGQTMTNQILIDRVDRIQDLSEKLSKMLFIINGAALLGVLALMAQLYSAEQTVLIAKSMAWAAGLFLVGLLCAVFSVFWELLSLLPLIDKQFEQPEKQQGLLKTHISRRFTSAVCMPISIVAFMVGAILSFAILT
jgi:hypothetical protein